MRFYWLRHVPEPNYSGTYTDGHKWTLPGAICPVCKLSGGTAANIYPSVDLSHLPAQEQRKYSARLEENFAEFERLREQVRPLVPPGEPLWPGAVFGPMTGSAQGDFASLVLAHPWTLLMKREALERLQAEGLGGLKGGRTELRFRKKNPPELLEMELLSRGRFHAECLPVRPPQCPKCERKNIPWQEKPILDAATLPQDMDLFRLADFGTLIIGTERFVEAVQRLGYEQDVAFQELPVRGG